MCILLFVYIPHSSDKTKFSCNYTRQVQTVYIPHSSDKTLIQAVIIVVGTLRLHPS